MKRFVNKHWLPLFLTCGAILATSGVISAHSYSGAVYTLIGWQVIGLTGWLNYDKLKHSNADLIDLVAQASNYIKLAEDQAQRCKRLVDQALENLKTVERERDDYYERLLAATGTRPVAGEVASSTSDQDSP